ncbi:phage protease [Megalodesulfovibrio paquesii]
MDTFRAAFSYCFELPAAPSQVAPSQATGQPVPAAPAEIQLLPAGPEIVGRDGRRFVLPSAQAVVDAFAARGRPAPIDRDHVGEEPLQEAPAAGWITSLRVADDGTVWGSVDWTPRGGRQVADREYRWISPVLLHDRGGVILDIAGAGLTNNPNLPLRALNARGATSQEDPMATQQQQPPATAPAPVPSVSPGSPVSPDIAAITAVLGLPATAGPQEVVTAINSIKASAMPDLTRYVPRADYDAAAQRAANAEAKLAGIEQQAKEAAIEAAIGEALKAGKIVPATADFYRASCRQDGGLEAFRAFCAVAPAIGTPSAATGAPPEGAAPTLDAPARAVCAALGIAEADYAKALHTTSAEGGK